MNKHKWIFNPNWVEESVFAPYMCIYCGEPVFSHEIIIDKDKFNTPCKIEDDQNENSMENDTKTWRDKPSML